MRFHNGAELTAEDVRFTFADVRAKVEGRRRRNPADCGQIVRRRQIALAGTRIPTAAVWNLHQAGLGDAAIIREHPRLTRADIREAIKHETARRRKTAS